MNLPIELKTRIYEHIGRVQQHLGELPADEKRDILQSIETHIHDALAARSEGEPTMELLEAIIAEMDPPESYGTTSPLAASASATSLSARARILLFGTIGILCLLFIAIWLSDPFSSQWMGGEPPAEPSHESTTNEAFQAIIDSSRPVHRHLNPLRPMEGVVGKWTAIDFVPQISDFHPRSEKWKGDFAVKELRFFEDGTTDKSWWTWKDDQLLHSGDKSAAGFMIAKIDQKDYLFVEWISGDVLREGKKPKYYVFRRGGYINPNEPKIIQEGVGWGALRAGAAPAELIAEFGEPDSPNSSMMSWHALGARAEISNGRAASIHFLNNFDGATTKGIQIGSTEEELLEAYGNPEHISYATLRNVRGNQPKPDVYMRWPKQGVRVTLNPETGVKRIDVSPPTTPADD